MLVSEFLPFAKKLLQHIYEPSEAHEIVCILIEEILLIKKQHLGILDKEIDAAEEMKLSYCVEELQKGKPLQYVLGYAWFRKIVVDVNESVLIPRPETEELIDWLLNENKDKSKLKVLDIGTGSGCIAISIAKEKKDWEMHAIDVSEDALTLAQHNAKKNVCQVHFKQLDILSPEAEQFLKEQQFDIIISNPPYIPEIEKQEMHINVKDFEPSIALFVPNNNPLLFYQRIIEIYNGIIYFEIAASQSTSLLALAEKLNREIYIQNDMSGNPRMAKVSAI
ncbi:MAG: peptide chain release factor N(5)-glutamine methyltransferase [Bacteroidia bacterium]